MNQSTSNRCLGIVMGLALPLAAWAISRNLADHFTVVKWGVVYAAAVVALLVISLSEIAVVVPRFPRWMIVLFACLATSLFVSYGMTKGWNFSKTVVDRASLACLFVAFFTYIKGTPAGLLHLSRWVSLATLGVVLVGASQIFNFNLLSAWSLPSDRISSTFGNVNMTAQFLGTSVFFQLFAAKQARSPVVRGTFELLIAATIVYVALLLNRSVWLALALSALVLFLTKGLPPLLQLGRIGAFVAAMALAMSGPSHISQNTSVEVPDEMQRPAETKDELSVYAPNQGEIADVALGKAKMSSAAARLRIWASTIDMIVDRPWGVGPGFFEFGVTPYQTARKWDGPAPHEQTVFRSPHNDYLLFASENGVHALMMALIIMVACFWKIISRRDLSREDGDDRRDTRAFILGIGSYFLVEAFFQFPLDNAVTVYLLVASIAIAMAYLYQALPLGAAGSMGKTVVLSLVLIAVGASAYRYIWANHIGFTQFHSLGGVTRACDLDPFHWRACVAKAHRQFRLGEIDRARSTLQHILARQPYVFPAKKLMGQMDIAVGLEAEGCSTLREYNSWFLGKSSARGTLQEHCETHLGAEGVSGAKL